jgi:hypothetical protein
MEDRWEETRRLSPYLGTQHFFAAGSRVLFAFGGKNKKRSLAEEQRRKEEF